MSRNFFTLTMLVLSESYRLTQLFLFPEARLLRIAVCEKSFSKNSLVHLDLLHSFLMLSEMSTISFRLVVASKCLLCLACRLLS